MEHQRSALDQALLERVASLGSAGEYIRTLAEVASDQAQSLKDMLGRGATAAAASNSSSWRLISTLLTLLQDQADIVCTIADEADRATIAKGVR